MSEENNTISRPYLRTRPYACKLKMRNGFEKVVVLSEPEFNNAAMNGIKEPFNLNDDITFFTDPRAPIDFNNQMIIYFRFQHSNDHMGFFIFEEC
jgi:hypothetical protein